MKTKIIKITHLEMTLFADYYPECSVWGFDVKDYLETMLPSHDPDLYADIATARDEGYDVVKFEVADDVNY